MYYRAVVAVAWLAGAWFARDHRAGRLVFSYAAGAIALAHIGSLLGLAIANGMSSPDRTGPPMGALIPLAGAALGFGAGVALGHLARSQLGVYLVLQIAAVGFLVFLPLVRW